MSRPSKRTSTFRKIFVRTPGAKNKLHYRLRKPSKAVCSSCHSKLLGVLHGRPIKFKKASKTSKRPERKYGGTLCSKCSRAKIKQSAREI